MATECGECGCETVSQRIWAKAAPTVHAQWLREGKKVLQARGLCRACYLRAQ